MHKFLIVASLLIGIASQAAAQDSMAGMKGKTGPATEAYMQAMNGMNDQMKKMATTGDPNKDFVMMMAPHHQAAVEMAQAYLKYGSDPELKRMSEKIISSQKREIAEMTAWQKKHGGH